MFSNQLNKFFFQQVSNAPLIIYRIIFGALMLFSTIRFIYNGWVYTHFIEPEFYFTFYGFHWIKPLPEIGMYVVFTLIAISSLFIIIGFKYKLSIITFFILFTYTELIDKTHYLNHYYFVSLISFLMCWLPANKRFSIDVKLNPKIKTNTTNAWHINIIKFQIVIVYFFAGIAKINFDWLINAQPLKLWLHSKHDVLDILKKESIAYLASWFGMIYDIIIPFALLWRKSRMIAFIFVIIFHIATWLLFPIGIFPWVMITGATIFFSSTFHEKILQFFSNQNFEKRIKKNVHTNKKITKILILSYVFLQITIPMRYLFYPNKLFWTEEGYRFSWRVMLMEKHGYAQFFIKNKDTGNEIEVINNRFLTPRQEKQMSFQPDFILQYAQHLKSMYQDTTIVVNHKKQVWENISVSAKIMVTLNGRPSQLFVSKKHDLTKKKYNLCSRNWIEPFKEK